MVRDRRAHLFTIYGEPGVGKSRLAREFADGVEGATVLAGRSLSYGEGVTYWPLAEMVKIAAGITDDDPVHEAVAKLRACCGDDAVADLLALAVGVLEGIEAERSQQEIAWAAHEWAAELADAQPLILVFEDVHWAEDPLLELIEHLAERVKDAPLLIVCLARPELLDIRPGWGGGRLRAAAIELEPLAPEESEELLDALLADHELSASERRTLLEKTEGNPLFVEETTRMLLEGGTSSKRIPDTLQAIIAARIDRLPRNEKRLLQRASVIGRIFWEGAVGHLASDIGELEPVLDSLLQRDFLTREHRSSISGEQAYRFKHVLIRDVAYSGLAKAARAELHLQVTEWLYETAGEELVEIRAYHLDQAATLHEELDGSIPPELAARAAAALEKAGRRTLAREANRSARRLLVRAVEIEPTLQRRFLAARAARRIADLPAQAVEMERVFADATEVGRQAAPGPRPDRARRERAPARSRPAARARARRAGARPARGREARGSVRGAHDACPDRLVARRSRRRRALDRQGARGRTGDRPQGSRGERRRRARELRDRAARSRSRHAGSSRRRWSWRRKAATSPPSAGRSSRRRASTRCGACSTRRRPGSRAPRSSSPSPATPGRWPASATTTAGSSAVAATSSLPTAASAMRSGS